MRKQNIVGKLANVFEEVFNQGVCGVCLVQFVTPAVSSMIKRVLGQPNFSPQTNATQLFPKLTQTLTTYHPLKLTQTYRVVLS